MEISLPNKLLFMFLRLLHGIFHIGPVIRPRLPYQAQNILHRLFSSIDFYIAENVFELTNCENKSLSELPLFKYFCFVRLFVCLMVFNATFNNISVISWRSVLLVEET